MKKFSLLSLICACATVFTFSSCLDSEEDDMTVYQQLSSYFNVYHSVNGQQTMSDGVSYNITYNYTKGTADLTVSGIKLPDGTSYPSLSFTELTFTQSSSTAWRQIYALAPTPSGSNFSISFGDLTFDIADNYVEDYYAPATNINYMIDNYTVYSFPKTYLTEGTPTVTGPSSMYTSSEPSAYSISFDPSTGLATISFQEIQFASSMPAQNVRFKEIPFTASANTLTLTATDPFTPYTVSVGTSSQTETPYTSVSVSNLSGYYCTTTGAKISFTVEMGGETYTVVIDSLYANMSEE